MGAGLFGSGPDLAPQPSFRPFPLLFRGCTSSWLQLPAQVAEAMRMAGLGNQRQLLLETPPQSTRGYPGLRSSRLGRCPLDVSLCCSSLLWGF